MTMEISDEQKKIIDHVDGPLLVMASPGSGKTRILTERIKCLLEQQRGGFHVLALTFTNKAALEMKNRLVSVKGIEKRSFIGTIHSFCEEVLRKHGYTIGLKNMPHIFESNDDRIAILLQVIEANPDLKRIYLSRGQPKEQAQFIYNALNYISNQKKNLKGVTDYSIDAEQENKNISLMYNEYNDLLLSQNAMDFDDVILFAYRIFAERSDVARIYRQLYKFISIDEAQDLNYAQYEFIKILCNGEHKNVFMVGDTNQSLYHFNGSDSKFMKEHFTRDFDAPKCILNINFRSSKSVIRVANLIKPGSIDPSWTKVDGAFQIEACENEIKEAEWVIAKIIDILENGHQDITGDIFKEDFAILARNKYQFENIKQQLDKSNLNYNIRKGSEGLNFESDLLRIFDLGLRVLANHQDQLHFLGIVKLLNIVQEFDNIPSSSAMERLGLLTSFLTGDALKYYPVILDAWQCVSQNINMFLKSLAFLRDYINDDMDPNEKGIIISDIAIYESVWRDYAQNTRPDLKSLQHFRTQLALGINNMSQDPTGITLSTVHFAKGLEFKVVFIVGLTQGTFPDYRAIKSGGIPLEEEKNSIYVAITRAERLLFMTYPKYRFMPWDDKTPKKQTPSEYIEILQRPGY